MYARRALYVHSLQLHGDAKESQSACSQLLFSCDTNYTGTGGTFVSLAVSCCHGIDTHAWLARVGHVRHEPRDFENKNSLVLTENIVEAL